MSVREHWINVRVNPEELARIREKQKELGIRNTGAYMRKMAMDGYCVNLDLSDVVQVSTLLRRCSNNLNQYAKRANESGSIYAEDIRDLQKRLDELWEMQKLILKRLYWYYADGRKCAGFLQHTAQMKLSVPLHIFGGFPVDIVVFGKRVR